MHIVLLKCPHVQIAFLIFTSCDNQALVGYIQYAAVAVHLKIGQSSHKMYSNNIGNFQKSMTILNACKKKSGKLLNSPRMTNRHLIYILVSELDKQPRSSVVPNILVLVRELLIPLDYSTYPWPITYNAAFIKEASITIFRVFDSTWDWTPVFRTISERSDLYVNEPVK